MDQLDALVASAAGWPVARLFYGVDLPRPGDAAVTEGQQIVVGFRSRKLMIDANQAREVGQAINWIKALKRFDPCFIKEPPVPTTSKGIARSARLSARSGWRPARCARTAFFSGSPSPAAASISFRSTRAASVGSTRC